MSAATETDVKRWRSQKKLYSMIRIFSCSWKKQMSTKVSCCFATDDRCGDLRFPVKKTTEQNILFQHFKKKILWVIW
jgi:hypothetical protein